MYQGPYKEERPHGQGTYIDHKGNKQEGYFLDGKRMGKFVSINEQGEQEGADYYDNG